MSKENKRWVVTLNVDYASETLLNKDELFDPVFQNKNSQRMIWGLGNTEDEALKDAIKNLTEEDILHISLSESDLCDFIDKHGGRETVRNSWFDENGDPHLLPSHDALMDFCDRHSLSQEARKELASFFDVGILSGEEVPRAFIPCPKKD